MCLVAHIYNLTKFARFKAQSDNMCKVDHQGLSYVKVLRETHVLNMPLVCLISHNSFLALSKTMVRVKIRGGT